MAGNRSRVPLGDGQAGLFPDENFEFQHATAFSRLLGNGKHFPLPYFKKLAIRYSQKPPEAVEGQQ